MNNYLFNNKKTKYYVFFGCLINIWLVVLLVRYLFNSHDFDVYIGLTIITALLFFSLLLLIKSSYHVFINVPQTIVDSQETLVLKFLNTSKIIHKKNITEFGIIPPYLNLTLFPIKMILDDMKNEFLLPYSLKEIIPVMDAVKKVNHDCKIDIPFDGEKYFSHNSAQFTFCYSWDTNIYYSTIVLCFGIVITSSMFTAILTPPASIFLFLFPLFAFLTLIYFKNYMSFFINTPWEIKIVNDCLEIKIGFRSKEIVPIKEIEKIFYRTGIYYSFSIKTKKRRFYFTTRLKNYRLLINALKQLNSEIEVDYKSIRKIEEKENRK